MAKITKKSQIKQDLLDQLERQGIYGQHYLDLIEDYMKLYDIKNKLLKDGKENPYTVWQNSETSFGRKKNDSIDQAVKVSQQMLKILTFLGIKPSPLEEEDLDEEM
jgi:phage terminase small subunit